MTLMMKNRIEYEKGEEHGEERMLLLIERLIEDKRFDDITRIKTDIRYRQELYNEYGII